MPRRGQAPDGVAASIHGRQVVARRRAARFLTRRIAEITTATPRPSRKRLNPTAACFGTLIANPFSAAATASSQWPPSRTSPSSEYSSPRRSVSCTTSRRRAALSSTATRSCASRRGRCSFRATSTRAQPDRSPKNSDPRWRSAARFQAGVRRRGTGEREGGDRLARRALHEYPRSAAPRPLAEDRFGLFGREAEVSRPRVRGQKRLPQGSAASLSHELSEANAVSLSSPAEPRPRPGFPCIGRCARSKACRRIRPGARACRPGRSSPGVRTDRAACRRRRLPPGR